MNRPFRLLAIIVLLFPLTSSLGQTSAAKPSAASPQASTSQTPTAQPSTSSAEYLKEALVFESDRVKATYQDDGSNTRERTAVIRVLSQAGVQGLAVLKFPYTSADESVEFDYIRVRKPDGTVMATPDYNIQDMPAEVTRDAPMYSDVHEKHVTVKALGVGDTLEYSVRYRSTKPQVPGQFWFDYSFTKDVIAKDEELEIDVPGDKYVKVVSPEYPPKIREEGGRQIYTWKTANLERKDNATQITQPRREAPKPSVEMTTFRSWEAVGRWYGELQRSQVVTTPQIQAKAADLTRGLSSDDDKIRSIYDFVSTKYHYVSLSFGIGRYQPHPAEDVLENEYGDCKDKHTLLAALLKAAGYDAWPALINATRKLDPDVPSPGQFDHVITVVPRGGTLLWLDTTPEIAPFGLLLANIRDKQALVIPTDKPAALMTTPANPPFPGAMTFVADGQISADGTLKAHIQETMRGDAEILYRYSFRGTSTAQWKDLGQRVSYSQGFSGEVSDVKATAPDATDKPFQFSYDYTRKPYGDWDNHRIPAFTPVFGIEGYGVMEKRPEEPVLLGALGEVVYTAKLQLPSGYTATVPDKMDLKEDFADYHSSYAFNDGVLTETRQLTIKKNEVPLSSWDSFKKFAKAVSDDRETWTVLGNGEEKAETAAVPPNPEADRLFREGYDAMQRRDITAAEESFRRVLELNPKYPGAHGNLGLVYMTAGSPEAAIRELRKEEEVNPNEPFAYMTLARIFTYQRKNTDAIVQLQKLLAIDPKSRDAALNLGELLYNEKKYPEAIAVLEKALEIAPASASLKYELGYAYIKNGDREKGLALLQKALTDQADTDQGTMALNNVAYSLIEMDVGLDIARQYATKSLEQLQAASLKPGAGRTALINTLYVAATWDTVGWIYFKQGQYDKALPYLKASWLLNQNDEVADHLGQLYTKTGKKQEAAQLYKLAYAVIQMSPRTPNNTEMMDKIKEHYRDLMGKDADPGRIETTRRANGTFTPMPSEELSRMREVRITTTPHPLANGTFSIIFSPGKVEEVTQIDGDDSLKALTDKIKTATFNVEFPNETPTRLVRHGIMSCGSLGCDLTLILPDDRSLLAAE